MPTRFCFTFGNPHLKWITKPFSKVNLLDVCWFYPQLTTPPSVSPRLVLLIKVQSTFIITQPVLKLIWKYLQYISYYTCDGWVEEDCDPVALFLWRETNYDGDVLQHQHTEPLRHHAVLAGAELDVGDEHRLQQAGHHQSEADGEENICG